MNRVDNDRPVQAVHNNDPLVRRGLDRGSPVSVPLDFLQGLSGIAQHSLERRPPRLRLKRNERERKGLGLAKLEFAHPVLSKETAEIAYQVAELVLRRKESVDTSNDLAARRGMASLERICRMFEHVYTAQANAGRHGDPI